MCLCLFHQVVEQLVMPHALSSSLEGTPPGQEKHIELTAANRSVPIFENTTVL
jgi:hypothetical protein